MQATGDTVDVIVAAAQGGLQGGLERGLRAGGQLGGGAVGAGGALPAQVGGHGSLVALHNQTVTVVLHIGKIHIIVRRHINFHKLRILQ